MIRPPTARLSACVFAAFAALAAAGRAAPPNGNEEPPVFAWHTQSTVVEQWHGPFGAAYSGPSSLSAQREDKHTATLTGFLSARLWSGAALFYDPEFSQGNGLSGTVGMAGFPNGEATRAGAQPPQYNTARLYVRQTIGLGGPREKVEAAPHETGGMQDINRVTITIGKLSAADAFDDNAFSHDPRTQFLNWALMDDAAWDYPADVKGYTGGAVVAWNQPSRTVRWGAFLEPVAANERQLDTHLRKALGQVLEWEERYAVEERRGAIRPMVFWNRAHMGSYAEAVRTAPVDVTLSRAYRSKAGAGVSWNQEIADDLGVFARAGFNDGANETWAFTEVDRTVSAGLSIAGTRWGRKSDTLAIAALANGLSGPHRRYLAAGGTGFMVGDGRLSYAAEQTIEAYYNWRPLEWLALAFDYQFTRHPGYNRDRGPVSIYALRAHLEL